MWDRPAALREVVADLRSGHYAETADEERGHTCEPRCSHSRTRGRALMDELAEVVVPPQEAMKRPSARRHRVSGSPAPWSARAAELLDEIERGAVDLVGHARVVLGLPVATVRAGHRRVALDRVQLDVAARHALGELPELLGLLLARPETRTHHLAATLGDDGNMRPGRIEGELWAWRSRARKLLGYEARPARLTQVPNPDNPHVNPEWWRGRVASVSCGAQCTHESCWAAESDRARTVARWVQARCPWCGRASLIQDPETGDVLCNRGSCFTPAGDRSRWTVAELDRLGLLVTSTAREETGA